MSDTFETTTKLSQDVDFRVKEGDMFGNYLKGIVLRRKEEGEDDEKSENSELLKYPVYKLADIREQCKRDREEKE